MKKIQCALINVWDKSNLDKLAKFLKSKDIEILSTDLCSRFLKKMGIEFKLISELIKDYHFLDSEVKIFHPLIFYGLLSKKTSEEQLAKLNKIGGNCIDVLVVNFPEVLDISDGVTWQEVLESFEINNISLISTALKNFTDVCILTEPCDYESFIKEFNENDGVLSKKFIRNLMIKAVEKLISYELEIYNFLTSRFPEPEYNKIFLKYIRVKDLPYGENLHQKAMYCIEPNFFETSFVNSHQLQGKEPTFNNILSFNIAIELIKEFEDCAIVFVKEASPVVVVVGKNIEDAFNIANGKFSSLIKGCVICTNSPVEKRNAKDFISIDAEAIISTKFTAGALEVFKSSHAGKQIAVIQIEPFENRSKVVKKESKYIVGGLLIQDYDDSVVDEEKGIVVATKRKVTKDELYDMSIAWKVCKHIKSHSAVIVNNRITCGIGIGQPLQTDAINIAVMKAGKDIYGASLAVDEYLSISEEKLEELAKKGITGIIIPGVHLKDDNLISLANSLGISIVFTGMTHLKH